MAVTNLTGTKWKLNETILPTSDFLYEITGTISFSHENIIYVIPIPSPLSNSFKYIQFYNTSSGGGGLRVPTYSFNELNYGGVKYSKKDKTWTGYYKETSYSSLLNFSNIDDIILYISGGTDATKSGLISWLENNGTLQQPEPSGYEVTFVTNGGTSVTKLEDVEELPTPLPTTTKSNHVFAGWYYDNLFTQKATAGATIESNVTLYAKWYTPTTWCEDIADAIREKESSSDLINHVDFADRIEALPSPKEEQTKTVSPTTSSQDVLPDANKVLSKVTINAIPTETKSQQPNLLSGNQVINATSGNFMTSFTITKDTINHIASNIRSGKTLYGVTGNLQPAKAEETKTITSPDFSSGNIVVTPTTDKVMTQVKLNKDVNLIADNIKSGVTIFGITGTYSGTPQGETWVINESPTLPLTGTDTIFNVNFSSNSSSFSRLTLMSYEDEGMYSTAIYFGLPNIDVYDGLSLDAQINMWNEQAYRTVTFETAPTGDLLTWLQANAVKQ